MILYFFKTLKTKEVFLVDMGRKERDKNENYAWLQVTSLAA